MYFTDLYLIDFTQHIYISLRITLIFTEAIKKSYQCDKCFKCYRYSPGLMRHKKYECGKEPQFECPHCHYKAKQKENLKAHLARRHFPLSKII